MTEEKKIERHESFAVLQVSRTHGGHRAMFGSSVMHGHSIRLRIKRAHVARDLSNDWYRDDNLLIEIEMSPVQWAEAITNMNSGVGTPVTLLRVEGKDMPDCPSISKRAQFDSEFEESMKAVGQKFADSQARIAELLEKKTALTIAEKKEISALISSVQRVFSESVPFVQSQFTEAMEKTVVEAKGEIEAHYTHRIVEAGLTALGLTAPDVPKICGAIGEEQ